jgi:protein SCO1/2
MKNMTKSKMSASAKIAAFAMFGLLITGIIVFLFIAFIDKTPLPVLGEAGHVAGAFSFINQDGQPVTEKSVHDKVTVVEYFFTSCPSICPQMNKNLKEVYEKFKEEPGFVILSHTVDPERDSVPVMKTYSKKYEAAAPGWQFLTGNKDSLYARAMQDYLLAAVDSGSSNFIHTQYVALLDRKRQIRGFYDMTSRETIPKLDADIQQLLKEHSN